MFLADANAAEVVEYLDFKSVKPVACAACELAPPRCDFCCCIELELANSLRENIDSGDRSTNVFIDIKQMITSCPIIWVYKP